MSGNLLNQTLGKILPKGNEGEDAMAILGRIIKERFKPAGVNCDRCGSEHFLWIGEDKEEYDNETNRHIQYVKGKPVKCLVCSSRMTDLLCEYDRLMMLDRIARRPQGKKELEENYKYVIEKAKTQYDKHRKFFDGLLEKYKFSLSDFYRSMEQRERAY